MTQQQLATFLDITGPRIYKWLVTKYGIEQAEKEIYLILDTIAHRHNLTITLP